MSNIEIFGFIPTSLVDWDGKVSAVIFLGGCNFKCCFCSNKKLVIKNEDSISFDIIKNILEKNKEFTDGIVITGGEPTLSNLEEFCKEIKKMNLKIKLDTNGNNPTVLRNLLEKGFIDYVAMDIKGPSYLYQKIVGNVNIKNIEESIKILNDSKIDFEFRITLAPLIDQEIRFFDEKEVEDISKWVFSITNNKENKIFLQRFISRDKEEMLDERLSNENLDLKMQKTPEELLEKAQKIFLKNFLNTKIRNL